MSTRIGMADGRCLTEYTSNRLLQDAIYASNNIDIYDNYKFRKLAEQNGPDHFQGPLKNAACGNPNGVFTIVAKETQGGNC